MVTVNGLLAPPGEFVTVTHMVAFTLVSVVVYVVELNPTIISEITMITIQGFILSSCSLKPYNIKEKTVTTFPIAAVPHV